MSTERDELARIAKVASNEEGLYVGELTAEYIADAILAAGYRRPRQVTTVEELDALPNGSVLILRDSKNDPHPAQKGEHGWRLPFVDGFWTAEKILAGAESAEVVE